MDAALRLIGNDSNRDVVFALGVIGILVVLFAPLPAWALDVGLTFSLAFSILILMVALWIEKPLDFSSFPTVLLIATILRLALNIASTRLILANGHTGTDAAGGVIYGFSQLMIGGNYVIGLIVFAILVIINFIVITKGATRIAEVGARFTLDAIPGKQMAIDADLAAGLIDDVEARDRRKTLEDESAFFGSMDGASKFVRGDAMAGMIIVFINIIGGIIVGVAQMGITMGEAASSYTTLTVGDGLASQIPALVVSLAAGLLVTKGRNVGSTDKAVMAQLGEYPKALLMVAGMMAVMGFIPGLPFLPFVGIGAAIAIGGVLMPKRKKAAAAILEAQQETQVAPKEIPAEESLKIEDLQLEVGSRLLTMISNPERGLPNKVKSLRRRFASEFGFLLPPVRIKDNLYVPPDEYRISVQDVEVAKGIVRPGCVMAIDPTGADVDMPGEPTRDPSFDMPARWISEAQAEEAEGKGYTVVSADSVLITHLSETIKDHLPSLLTYSAMQKLIETLEPEYRKLLSDIVPGQLSQVALQRVLQGLLAERVSIRNLPAILEAVAEATGWTRNPQPIIEHVRQRLSKQISSSVQGEDGFVPVIALSGRWERCFIESLQGGEGGERVFAMPPNQVQEFITAARATLHKYKDADIMPVILTSADARPFVRSLLERAAPSVPVISHNELHSSVAIKTVDQIA
ncbi:flagellar biosynthesis protein FlhA [Parvularcula lutaonensis]|uniref:Flagellar biosynthesis protein FlhA n=1 Tax=Parvularcula lutaonensis TaxID=491923 RepID=A0ABV7ME65_9PROT|nr:flagellar biosynthesis protein FlhA [Parvularcula lutaonensis]GGY50890.1 flagellar biosynthesis protein FlhA [Parvularcula lutaonensis]